MDVAIIPFKARDTEYLKSCLPNDIVGDTKPVFCHGGGLASSTLYVLHSERESRVYSFFSVDGPRGSMVLRGYASHDHEGFVGMNLGSNDVVYQGQTISEPFYAISSHDLSPDIPSDTQDIFQWNLKSTKDYDIIVNVLRKRLVQQYCQSVGSDDAAIDDNTLSVIIHILLIILDDKSFDILASMNKLKEWAPGLRKARGISRRYTLEDPLFKELSDECTTILFASHGLEH